MGPMCAVCVQGAYLHIGGIVSTCVKCEDEGFMKQMAQIPADVGALLVHRVFFCHEALHGKEVPRVRGEVRGGEDDKGKGESGDGEGRRARTRSEKGSSSSSISNSNNNNNNRSSFERQEKVRRG